MRFMFRMKSAGTAVGMVLLSPWAGFWADAETRPTVEATVDPVSDVAKLRHDFISGDYGLQLVRVSEFERQAIALLDEAPLRLGPLSSAILDLSQVNLVGQLAALRYYEFVESDQADEHRVQVDLIATAMSKGRSGSESSPYRAHSVAEARALVEHGGGKSIGSIYTIGEESTFLARISVLRDGKPLTYQYFDLTPYRRVMERMEERAAQHQASGLRPGLLGMMMQMGDTTARLTMGQVLLQDGRPADALRVLEPARASDNALVDPLLARAYRGVASQTAGDGRKELLDSAVHHLYQASASGYDSAMRELAHFHFSSFIEDGSGAEGLVLLELAANRGNRAAALEMALHLAGGTFGAIDRSRADAMIGDQLNDPPTSEQRTLAKQLLLPDAYGYALPSTSALARYAPTERQSEVADLAVKWLKSAARNDADLLVLLAQMYARGAYVDQSFRKARSHFRRAARLDPDDPELVNNIAWTLAVTHHERLRNPRFALRIMVPMMNNDEDAGSSPAYIDTLAAIHAALGSFAEAVKLQRRAIAIAAREGYPEGMLTELQERLAAFEERQAVIDAVP